MAFQWPVDKLTLINRALATTGDNLINVLDDGSDEYNICSPAYEDALAVLIEESNWGWGTKVAELTASPTAPTDTDWDTAYVLPADLVHIIWIKSDRGAGAGSINVPILYDILAGQIVLNSQGGPPPPPSPQTPATITMKYVSSDNSDATSGTPLFVRALTMYVMAAIYRGLHGDKAEGAKMFAAAQAVAQSARTRYDMQKPKRSLWRSRITAARRMGRPWPPSGNYDSGSGFSG